MSIDDPTVLTRKITSCKIRDCAKTCDSISREPSVVKKKIHMKNLIA